MGMLVFSAINLRKISNALPWYTLYILHGRNFAFEFIPRAKRQTRRQRNADNPPLSIDVVLAVAIAVAELHKIANIEAAAGRLLEKAARMAAVMG
jgi:hypothetical protein